MCGDNTIPRVGGRHQAGHYTATKVAYLHGLYPLRRIYLTSQSATRPVSDENEQPMR